jgi:hypothetical protein
MEVLFMQMEFLFQQFAQKKKPRYSNQLKKNGKNFKILELS